jgi:hypothetical protein
MCTASEHPALPSVHLRTTLHRCRTPLWAPLRGHRECLSYGKPPSIIVSPRLGIQGDHARRLTPSPCIGSSPSLSSHFNPRAVGVLDRGRRRRRRRRRRLHPAPLPRLRLRHLRRLRRRLRRHVSSKSFTPGARHAFERVECSVVSCASQMLRWRTFLHPSSQSVETSYHHSVWSLFIMTKNQLVILGWAFEKRYVERFTGGSRLGDCDTMPSHLWGERRHTQRLVLLRIGLGTGRQKTTLERSTTLRLWAACASMCRTLA